MNKQILELQQTNLKLKDEGKGKEKQIVQLEGTLEIYKKDTTKTELNATQIEYLKARAGSTASIEQKVYSKLDCNNAYS